MFSRSRSACDRPGVVGEPLDDAFRDAREQDGLEVGARGFVRVKLGQIREYAGVEDRQQPGQLGVGDIAGELLVVRGRLMVPVVLAAHRHDHLVEQRVAQPGDLRPRPVAVPLAGVVIEDARPLPACGRPHPDYRPAPGGDLGDRDLQGNGVNVQVLGGVDPRRCLESVALAKTL